MFFRAAGNMPYARSAWDGTVSFWLSVDPERDLQPGFCDPVQIFNWAQRPGSARSTQWMVGPARSSADGMSAQMRRKIFRRIQ